MKALSIKQPWAHLIATGIKDIENRTWRTNFRGTFYIHASGQIYPSFKGNNLAFPVDQWEAINKKVDVCKKGEHDKFFLKSAIIGQVDIVDCVQDHPSIWAEKMLPKPLIKDYHCDEDDCGNNELFKYNMSLYLNQKPIWNWVLANPVLYDKPILDVKGRLGFWDPDFSIYRDLL